MAGVGGASGMLPVCVACAFTLALPQNGNCQQSSDQEGTPSSAETVEEIVVYGDKSLTHLRHELYVAEEEFFDVFNALNSNDDFDVECEYLTFLGSRRRHHLCMPRFAERAEAEATMNMMLSGEWYDYRVDVKRLTTKEEQMWTEMAELVSEHSELQDAMTKLARSKLIYDTELNRRKND